MRHRIVNGTGFGNPNPVILDNKGKIRTDLGNDVLKTYFSKEEYCDYTRKKDFILLGVEPAYQYEDLKVICIHRDINKSYIETGRAFGPYGSGIRATTKFYGDYKYNCKFTRFINKWHSKLFRK